MDERIQAQQRYGRIDVLINNAGQGLRVPIEKVDVQQYRSVFELNVVSVIITMQTVIPLMRAQGGGVIINISSAISKTSPEKLKFANFGPYMSTKYALNAITLTARQELVADNIHVGLVYPGITATDFNIHSAEGHLSNQSAPGMMPADSPESVAEAILEAVQTTAAEVYAESVKKAMGQF